MARVNKRVNNYLRFIKSLIVFILLVSLMKVPLKTSLHLNSCRHFISEAFVSGVSSTVSETLLTRLNSENLNAFNFVKQSFGNFR